MLEGNYTIKITVEKITTRIFYRFRYVRFFTEKNLKFGTESPQLNKSIDKFFFLIENQKIFKEKELLKSQVTGLLEKKI
jgi:hypothetical protein